MIDKTPVNDDNLIVVSTILNVADSICIVVNDVSFNVNELAVTSVD